MEIKPLRSSIHKECKSESAAAYPYTQGIFSNTQTLHHNRKAAWRFTNNPRLPVARWRTNRECNKSSIAHSSPTVSFRETQNASTHNPDTIRSTPSQGQYRMQALHLLSLTPNPIPPIFPLSFPFNPPPPSTLTFSFPAADPAAIRFMAFVCIHTTQLNSVLEMGGRYVGWAQNSNSESWLGVLGREQDIRRW